MGHYFSKPLQQEEIMDAKKAHWMGKQYADSVLADKEFKKRVVGGGWGKDFWRGFKSGFSGTLKTLGPVATAVGIPEVGVPASIVGSAVSGLGHNSNAHRVNRRRKRCGMMDNNNNNNANKESIGSGTVEVTPMPDGGGKRRRVKKVKRAASAKQKARGALVAKLMREKGVKMGQASKMIKEQNLAY